MTKTHFDIIIVGAGIAGLSSAKLLVKQGVDLCILESRDRIGGRIQSIKSSHTTIDCGASWIHGIDNNPIYELTQQYNIPTQRGNLRENFELYNHEGQLIENKDYLSAYQKTLDAIENFSISSPLSINDVLDHPSIAKLYDPYPGLKSLLYQNLVCYEGDQPERVAFLSNTEYEELSGDHKTFPNGYAELVQCLAENISIKLNQQVEKITQGELVTITTQDSIYTCNQVIVSVPVGVLKAKTIKFTPPLSQENQAAINNIGVGLLNKVIVEYKTPISVDSPQLYFYPLTTNPKDINLYVNIFNNEKITATVGYFAGDTARVIEQYNEIELKRLLKPTIAKVFGESVLQDACVKSTHWNKDPHACGAYSYIPVGYSNQLNHELAKSEGRIHFIGEATNPRHYSTVHGAYISGLEKAASLKL